MSHVEMEGGGGCACQQREWRGQVVEMAKRERGRSVTQEHVSVACMATCIHMVYYYYSHRWRLSRDRRKTRLFLCCVTRCAANGNRVL